MEIREGGVIYFFPSRQLDQLDRLLDHLESKRDRIHSQARELLEDSRQVGYLNCQCTMCRLGSIFSFQPNKLRHISKCVSSLDISFNIYLSQLVRLEGKLDFQGNRDFQTLNLGFPGHFD